MIAFELANFSFITRPNFYSLFSPSGKAYLNALLVEEKENAKQFVLTYDTRELRKLAAKAKRSSLTPEEEAALKKGKKSFQGNLASGGMIEDPEAIEVVRSYLDVLDTVDQEVDYLSKFKITSSTTTNSEVVFEREITFWNLHPQVFGEQVYSSLFSSPEYTRRELERLFNLKKKALLKQETAKVFNDAKQVELFLLQFQLPASERKILADKLVNLKVLGELTSNEFKTHLTSALNIFKESDDKFKLNVYEKVSKYLPQYHNQKVKWLIYTLAQYNFVEAMSITNRITLDQIYAFYRKADELCYCST